MKPTNKFLALADESAKMAEAMKERINVLQSVIESLTTLSQQSKRIGKVGFDADNNVAFNQRTLILKNIEDLMKLMETLSNVHEVEAFHAMNTANHLRSVAISVLKQELDELDDETDTN